MIQSKNCECDTTTWEKKIIDNIERHFCMVCKKMYKAWDVETEEDRELVGWLSPYRHPGSMDEAKDYHADQEQTLMIEDEEEQCIKHCKYQCGVCWKERALNALMFHRFSFRWSYSIEKWADETFNQERPWQNLAARIQYAMKNYRKKANESLKVDDDK